MNTSQIPEEAVEAAFGSYVGGNEVSGPDIAGDFLTREQLRTTLEAAAPHMLAGAWEDGYKASDLEWEQTADLVTPDEDRFVAHNPYAPTRG